MWMLELMGIVVVTGTFLGLAWRVTEDWWEKRQSRKALEAELVDTETTTPAPVDPTAN